MACVVVNKAVGAPVAPLADAEAPTPDDPANATTVIAWRYPPTNGVEVTVTFVKVAGANPAQTSAVPNCALVRRTSAHVHCMYEVDFTRIVNLRNKHKAGFEQRHGARLTFMPFFVRAAVIALQQWPIINATLEGDNIRYHRHINMGIAVALDWGLIVPVLKNAGDLNFLGLQRGISDLGERARTKKLKPEDVEGSTFTVTNPGQFGAVFGLPIINQPNSAIMGVGGITKQPMVITDKDGTDSIAIRSVVHLTLGYDHRLIDGAVADQFMDLVKKTLQTWSEEVG